MPETDQPVTMEHVAEMRTLGDCVQSLPQELQDMILDFTVAITPANVHIDEHYKPPVQLQINRATRSKAAATFYSDLSSRFEPVEGPSRPYMLKWIKSLSSENGSMVFRTLVSEKAAPL